MLLSMVVLMLPLLAINVVTSEANVTDQASSTAAFNVTSLASLQTEITNSSQTLVNNASSAMTTDSSLVTNASSVDTGNATTKFDVASVTANYSSKTSPGPSANQTAWPLSNGTIRTSQPNGTSLSSTSVFQGLSVFPHGIILALVIVVLIVLCISIISCCCCGNNSDGSNGPNGAILYEPLEPPNSNRTDSVAPLLSDHRQAAFGVMPSGQQQVIRGTTTAYW